MSSRKVSAEALADAVMECLDDYKKLADDSMRAAVKEAAAEARDAIKATAPKDTGKYAKSWSAKATKDTSRAYEMTVYSRNRYQLAHLLEHGHAKRGGGRVPARPHIAAAAEKAEESLERKIERSLKSG